MRIEDFQYELPKGLIAQRPLAARDGSRMMVLDRAAESWNDCFFRDLPDLLRGDELLVWNNTRVIPARLLGYRMGVRSERVGRQGKARKQHLTSQIEVFLLRQLEGDLWEALVHPGRKMRTGERVVFGNGEIEAEVIDRGELGLRKVRLKARDNLHAALERVGHVPLPPYINRPDEEADRERYQTVFAKQTGAVAAPTAGLHFSTQVIERLKARGVETCEITLHVGLGTFQPIRCRQLEDHRMHAEYYEIPEATALKIRRAKENRRPVLAIGTTVVRALESAATRAVQMGAGSTPGKKPEIEILPGSAETSLFIQPGFEFRVVDQLLTNFHLPKSSLLVLVAAFTGRSFLLRAYQHAVEQGYRFYSYGDCMLIRQ